MYTLTDIYTEILSINEINEFYIKKEIFLYLIDDYKEKINDYYLRKKISKSVNNNYSYLPTFQFKNKIFTIHVNDLPYKVSIKLLKQKVDNLLNINNMDYIFSHFCCSDKGIFYRNHIE
tara:strand:- start:1913 stop:2269 length:357 start_codon:yes stop_codon:yes gene_type:complete